jgi:hypothetical protein
LVVFHGEEGNPSGVELHDDFPRMDTGIAGQESEVPDVLTIAK